MDEMVKAAMLKWPNVPDCTNWLGLDARGDWYLRDDAAQAAGAFDSGLPNSKGSRLEHAQLLSFIERNYAADEQGHWFFQNGPQRVFVELARTPWVWRLQPDGQLHSHSGRAARFEAAFCDEVGHLYLLTDIGFGLLHSADMLGAVERVESGLWPVHAVLMQDLPERFGYVTSPHRARALQKNC